MCPLLNTLRRDGSPSKLLRGPGGAFSSCGMELDWSVGWSMSVAPSFSFSEHWGSGSRACWPRACHTAHRESERRSITERTVNSHGGAWGASGAHLASRARGVVCSDRPGPVCRPRAGVRGCARVCASVRLVRLSGAPRWQVAHSGPWLVAHAAVRPREKISATRDRVRRCRASTWSDDSTWREDSWWVYVEHTSTCGDSW